MEAPPSTNETPQVPTQPVDANSTAIGSTTTGEEVKKKRLSKAEKRELKAAHQKEVWKKKRVLEKEKKKKRKLELKERGIEGMHSLVFVICHVLLHHLFFPA